MSGFEDFERLKNNMIAVSQGDNRLTSIVVTSSTDAEGSTTVAYNLAMSLAAETSAKILLVDANFIRPGLNKFLGNNVGSQKGLRDLMATKEDLQFEEYVQEATPPNLYILAAGTTIIKPIEMFNSTTFKDLLDELNKNFQFVIFDASPVNICPETQVLCSSVDGVILVIRTGVTRREVVLNTCDQLRMAKVNILGLVLNRRKHFIPSWIYERL